MIKLLSQCMKRLILFIFLISCTPIISNTYIQDTGSIEVYFCPHEDCETQLLNFITSANESIHCALFDIGLESVQKSLLNKSKFVEVQIVTDNDYLHKFNHPFVMEDAWGLMHNKFCVIDGKKVSTGSMNPTNNGAHKNNNNLLFIESQAIAQNYEDEFQEMWNGTYKKGKNVKNPNIKIDKTTVSIYFCPEDHCATKIKQELQKAEKSIYFMTFSFTHDGIANRILLKHLDGVEVKGVMEARQVTKYSKYEALKYNIGDVYKDANKQNMHHKTFIIDNKTVITGSMNPTDGGDSRNDENVIILEDEEIAKQYIKEFERLYAKTTQ